jgi:cytochrome P450
MNSNTVIVSIDGEAPPALPHFDVLDPDFARDPFDVLRQHREAAPIHWDASRHAWIVTSHQAVAEALPHPALENDPRFWERYEAPTHPELKRFQEYDEAHILRRNVEDHLRLRRVVSKAFSPAAVRNLKPIIEGLVDECLDLVRPRGQMDMVADFAAPFPIRVISRMIGIPPNTERERRFKELSDELVTLVNPTLSLERRVELASSRDELGLVL